MKTAKQNLINSIFPLLLALIIGGLAGLGAVFFRWLIGFETSLFWSGNGGFLEQYQQASPWLKFGAPVLAGLVMGPLLAYFAPEVRGPGVPEVMAALALRDGKIRHRVTLIKSFATATFIAAGCSVGREGPIVQIGSSIGSSLTQLFRLGPDYRRLAVACGAAAGIAATFQAPMAGTLFAVEVLLFDLEVASLSNIVIAAVTGTVVSKLFWSDETVFQIPFFTLTHPAELLLYFGLGIAAGLFSLLFMAFIFGLTRLLNRMRIPVWLTPALGGLVVGLVGLFQPEALGVGYESINHILHGNVVFTGAVLLLLAKLITTSACVGSGMSGGIFAPSLFLGAVLGSIIGCLAQLIWPDTPLSPAHYALVGMGAVVAGTTLAPITAIMTIFELTYNYEIVLPLMTACIPAIIVVRLLHGYSIYETKLLVQGIRIVRGHDANRLRNMKVKQYLCRDFHPLRTQTPFHDLIQDVLTSPFPHFVVLDEQDRLAGVLTLRDVREQLADPEYTGDGVVAADLMKTSVITVGEEQNMEEPFHLFARHNISFMPVVSSADNTKVVGCLKKDDLLNAYNQHVLRDQVQPSARWICKLPDSKKKSR
ncbi:MAG: chloride channel protein [Thermodesulfobacteriota bacterium]|nr:chloride channel protein [Thermodesulfobacteriota bacterium]